MADILSQLNDVQRLAASSYNGASLIIAGAGSGKTRVLTYRIAYMVSCGVSPSEIMALTFTNKAAGEMRERIAAVAGLENVRGLWMGTFHSLFSRILRAECEVLGFSPTFTIYETSDSKNVVKTIIKDLNLNEDIYKVKDIFGRISSLKNDLITPHMYRENATLIGDDEKAGRGKFSDIYREYMMRCKRNNAMDFDDLLLYTNFLFRNHPEVAAKYQERFKYVLVDEYQDTNYSQYIIIKKIVEKHKNICVVGDDAQSIYSFRGAKIENILRFKTDYPNSALYKLEQNYRSTQTIVNAANSVIKNNSRQIDKNSFSKNDEGEPIKLIRSYTEREEAQSIAKEIVQSLLDYPELALRDMAILYRTNAQSRALEDSLRSARLPYKIYGGLSFYQRAEIKNILAYMRLIINHEDEEALRRIINVPARGIGLTSIEKVLALAKSSSQTFWQTLNSPLIEELGARGGAPKLKSFTAMIKELHSFCKEHNAYDTVLEVANRSGIIGTYKSKDDPENKSALENIEELVNSLKQAADEAIRGGDEPQTVEEWMQNVTLLTDMDNEKPEEKEKVTLMSIHASKGLEFKHIHLVGVEEGLFPSPMTADSTESLEEERRLFYVAITRAITKLVISFSLNRYKWGTSSPSRPSRFLKEIEPKFLDDPTLLKQNDWSDTGTDIEDKPLWGQEPKKFVRRNSTQENEQTSLGSKSLPLEQRRPLNTPMPSHLKRVTNTFDHPQNPEKESQLLLLAAGDRVMHDTFGEGVIITMERMPAGPKAIVHFDQAGPKTLLLKYAKLTKI